MFFCLFPTDPPNITHISGIVTVNQTDSVILNCTADGYPAPNVTWTRGSDNSGVTFPLTITGRGDEGAYTCTARNGVRESFSKDTFIIVQSKSKAFLIDNKKVVIIVLNIILYFHVNKYFHEFTKIKLFTALYTLRIDNDKVFPVAKC